MARMRPALRRIWLAYGLWHLGIFKSRSANIIGHSQDGSLSTMPVSEPQQTQARKRKQALSPELRELLHMLKSLETEAEAERAPQR